MPALFPNFPIAVERGATFVLDVTLSGVDLTGLPVRLQLRPYGNGVAVLDLWTDAATPTIVVTVTTNPDTSKSSRVVATAPIALTAAIPAGLTAAPYDMVAVYSSTDVRPLLAGLASITTLVTAP